MIQPFIASFAAGIAMVCLAVTLLHRQIRNIPEVKLKLAVGLVLTVLGVHWLASLYRDYAL